MTHRDPPRVAPVVALDWSDDSLCLQSCDASATLAFWEARTCASIEPGAAASCTWASASCPRQWALGGAPDALCVARRSNGGGVVGTSSGDGGVTLVGYPCVAPDGGALRYAEHSGGVRALEWSCDDGVLLSLDHTGELLQWRHVGGDLGAADASAEGAAAAEAAEGAYDSDIEHELTHATRLATHADELAQAAADGAIGGVGGGGAAVAPHHAELHPPTGWAPTEDGHEPPPSRLKGDAGWLHDSYHLPA